MAQSIELNLVLIRTAKEKDIAPHILQLLKQHRPVDVCNALLAAVEAETIKPNVFSIFLSAAKSIDCILQCLRQPYSIFVRKQAIKQYGKAFADVRRWEAVWKAIGGTKGLLDYLSVISVDEVKRLFVSIGSCSRGQAKPKEREQAIEELLKAMYSTLYPEAPYKHTDKRPLENYAIHLVPACSADFIRHMLIQGPNHPLYSECSKNRLLKAHGALLREYVVHSVFKNTSKAFPGDVDIYLQEFAYREPPQPGEERKFSASMSFSEKLLEQRLRSPDIVWPSQLAETKIYFSLLHRCIRKRVTKQRQHEILQLGLRLLEAKRGIKGDFIGREILFWSRIMEYWGKDPERWEDLVVKGLRLGLGGSGKNIGDGFIKLVTCSGIKEDRTWSALRLYCLHVPKEGVDIETSNDPKVLARKKWKAQVFKKLSDDKAIRLLKGLIRVNQGFDFLQTAPQDTILSMQALYDQRNFDALLFLTQLQARSTDSNQRAEAYKRAEEAVANLKSKSASSREQPERAQYAKAAGFFAIASCSLKLYGEFVTWLQRFVRDPLTVKVVFSRDAIAPADSGSLLSGIPNPLPQDLSLSTISASVAEANEILLRFHAHKQLAKREPSYQKYDWKTVSTVLHTAIKTRIARARKLQKTLNAADGELYSAIWIQTFALFSQVGAESMQEVQCDMRQLMTELPPKTLATTTQAMLETDNRYRATKSDGKEAEDESRVIEQLTYQCLLALAKGDKPILAEDLIVRTIIDRPDASSWHRQLLSISFFKRLPAKDAENLLLGFAKAIGEKLEEQSYVKIGEAAGTPSIVKVTTVKYLAQLLQDAQFISAEAAIDVLLELFKVATHPDIRLATLESMLSTLNSLCATELRGLVTNVLETGNPLIQKILAALDTVVPVVGSVNERRPPREQEWEEARVDLSKLPEPSINPSQRPLWAALVNAAKASSALRGYFVERLLLPALRISTVDHRKWLALFLKKHGAGFSVDKLPEVPLDPRMESDLRWNFTTLMPAELFDQADGYTRLILAPTANIRTFNAKLRQDEEKRNKPDVKHWLSLFDRSFNEVLKDGTFRLIGLIHHDWKPSIFPRSSGVSLQQCQNAVLAHMNILLENYDSNINSWSTLVDRLRHPTSSAQDYARWAKDCRPVLEQVVKLIDGKRTLEWSRDPNRKPSVLPSTSRPTLWLLSYPKPGTDDVMEANEQSAAFASELLTFLHSQLQSRTHSIHVEKLIGDIMTVSQKLNNVERLRVSIALGSLVPWQDQVDPVEETVRVNIAKKFVDHGREALKKDRELRLQVMDMVLGWQKSLVEDVREWVLDWKLHDRGLWNDVFGKPSE